MTTSLQIRLALAALTATAIVFTTALAGPAAPGESKSTVADDGPDAAKLWAQNCSRCHNMRPAKSFSDAQWDTIVHHMRVRGNITGGDARLIAEFLKGAN